ncbi:MAG: hypothetical protein ACF8QF_08680 [Phycisphaerales bacterium]
MTGHDRTASPTAERDAGDPQHEARLAREQSHLPEGRPPGPDAERLSVRIAIFLLSIGAIATLVTAYLVGGWDAMAIGVPAVLVYLLVGAIPYLVALASRISSKRRVHERLGRQDA